MTNNHRTAPDLRIVMEDVPDSHLVDALLPGFHEENEDVRVEVDIMHYDLMLDRILSEIGHASAPNGVVIFDNPWTYDFARGGLIAPIDDLLAGTGAIDWDDFSPSLRRGACLDGHVWGVPFYTWSFGLIYRHDLYREAGLEPPATLEQFISVTHRLTTDDRAGVAMQPKADYNAAEEWVNYLFAAGGRVQDEHGRFALDSPEARRALDAYVELYRNCAPRGSADWTFEESIAALAEDRAAQTINCHWWLPVLNDPNGPAGDLAGRFSLAEVPGGTGIMGVWYWSIPAAVTRKQRETAFRFISWIASKDANLERVAQGGAPVRVSTLNDPTVWERGAGKDYYLALERILDTGVPMLNGSNAEEATGVLGAAVHDAAVGTRSTEQAISDASGEMRALLEG